MAGGPAIPALPHSRTCPTPTSPAAIGLAECRVVKPGDLGADADGSIYARRPTGRSVTSTFRTDPYYPSRSRPVRQPRNQSRSSRPAASRATATYFRVVMSPAGGLKSTVQEMLPRRQARQYEPDSESSASRLASRLFDRCGTAVFPVPPTKSRSVTAL